MQSEISFRSALNTSVRIGLLVRNRGDLDYWPTLCSAGDKLLEDEESATSAKIRNGSSPSISPNGKKVAFVRFELTPEITDLREIRSPP